jgi:hypothetical protein
LIFLGSENIAVLQELQNEVLITAKQGASPHWSFYIGKPMLSRAL